MADMPIGGQIGQYKIEALIGEGGMALVYRAFQPNMNRHVALKVLRHLLVADTKYKERFRHEAQVIANLEHPHILPVHDFGEDGGRFYIVMRLIESGTLESQLRGLPLPMFRIATIIEQVADALDYAHSHDVIHRDVKPHNILIDDHQNCFLADFGISKIVGLTTGSTEAAVVGTADYMSPEQGQGRRVDARSDIYSLGIVLYQMATGRLPFHGENAIATVYQHVHHPVPNPTKFNPALPKYVEDIILKSLAKRPDDRYPTALKLADELEQAAKGPAAWTLPFDPKAKTEGLSSGEPGSIDALPSNQQTESPGIESADSQLDDEDDNPDLIDRIGERGADPSTWNERWREIAAAKRKAEYENWREQEARRNEEERLHHAALELERRKADRQQIYIAIFLVSVTVLIIIAAIVIALFARTQ